MENLHIHIMIRKSSDIEEKKIEKHHKPTWSVHTVSVDENIVPTANVNKDMQQAVRKSDETSLIKKWKTRTSPR